MPAFQNALLGARHDPLSVASKEATPATDVVNDSATLSGLQAGEQLPFLRERLGRLYGVQPGFAPWFDHLMSRVMQLAAERSTELRALDQQRLREPDWFLSSRMLAYSAYTERFAGNLQGVQARIPLLRELGVSYLHLLPFLKARSGSSDGGFAVASFDEVEPSLGSMDDLEALTAALRQSGISLCSDFVLNHVSDEHPWATAALAGDARYRGYFHVLTEPEDVAAYEQALAQVFPQSAPGNFTAVPAMGGHVWTTFYPYQWDLNYANPEVFAEMALALLRLANRGVEVFRLDSAAFLWKRPGTRCMNLPETHWILQALRSIMAIAAPGVLLKAEAIVPTRELPPYFGEGEAYGRECHLAYHSSLMSAAWLCLGEQDTRLLREVIAGTPTLPPAASWMTYVRCHDDIGWNVLRPELERQGSDAQARLAFASRFFAGQTTGSYASGATFQAHSDGGVHGTNGMSSALVGLPAARTHAETEQAVSRLLLLYALAFSVGGMPLIYMGDEIGLRNAVPDETSRPGVDGRDLHRPAFDEAAWARRHDRTTPEGMIHSGLLRLVRLRERLHSLDASTPVRVLPLPQPAVLGIERDGHFISLGNFSGSTITLDLTPHVESCRWQDLLNQRVLTESVMTLAPWSIAWLEKARQP